MAPMTTKKMSMELALLGFLKDGPLHGYQIHQLIIETKGLSQIWRIKQSQLYAYLGKLEDAGYINGSIEFQTGRPNRRVFELSASGKEIFLKWLVTPVEMPRQLRQEFMAKLFFAQREDPQLHNRLVNNQIGICDKWIKMQEDQLLGDQPDIFSQKLFDYRLGQILAAKNWLAELLPKTVTKQSTILNGDS